MTDRGVCGTGSVPHRPDGFLPLARLLAFAPLAFLLPPATALKAQRSGRSGFPGDLPILELTTSTRARAPGGAFWAGGGHAPLHHPALIAGQGFEVTVWGRTGHRDDVLHAVLSTGTNWMGGSLAVGMAVLDHGLTSTWARSGIAGT